MWALVAFLVGCSALAVAQDDRCLQCICQVRALKGQLKVCVLNPHRVLETPHCLQVESGCSAVGCVWDQGSLSCGPYQIKQPTGLTAASRAAVRDVYARERTTRTVQ